MLQTDRAITAAQRRSWTAVEYFVALLVLTTVLLLPAIYNRFPFVFPDTSAYLSVAYADSWPIDRAGFYGLILAPALLGIEGAGGVWLAILVQGMIIALTLVAAARRLLPGSRPWLVLALLTAVALASTLAWHATQLMPDAFTGALVLLVWLTASRNLGDRGTPLLWLATAVLTLVHYTHVGLVAVGTAATLLVCAFLGTSLREVVRRALAAVLVIASVLSVHTLVHGVYFNRWQPSPLGGYFLFARLYEDGLVPRWMDRHCGRDAPKPLCEIRPLIPRDSQDLLWGKAPSPIHDRINKRKGEPESWQWVDMVSEAAVGSLKEEPLPFAANAVRATADQFVHYRALDDECPENCRNLKLFEWRPVLTQPVHASRQLTDELPREKIRLATTLVSTIGLLLLLPLLLVAIRRRDTVAISLLATVALCLVANAAMAGALSDVHDRYQSRLVWLAPFAALLLIMRWRQERLPRIATRHGASP